MPLSGFRMKKRRGFPNKLRGPVLTNHLISIRLSEQMTHVYGRPVPMASVPHRTGCGNASGIALTRVITTVTKPSKIKSGHPPECHHVYIDLPHRLTIPIVSWRHTKANCASTAMLRNIRRDGLTTADSRNPSEEQNTKSAPQKAKAEFCESL